MFSPCRPEPTWESETTPNANFSSSDRPTGTGESSQAADESTRPEAGEPQQVLRHLSELLEYLAHYLNAKADSLKLSARSTLFRAELEIVAILAAAGVIVAGVTLVFVGVAGGLSRLFGNEPWLGNLSAGLLLLGCVSLVGYGYMMWRQKASRERSVAKYEQRKVNQQSKFGRSVAEQAAARRDE